MRKNAIEVKDVSISYRNLQSFSIKQSLLKFKKMKTEDIEAVKNVSFSVEEGDILGIIGKNGSGKSTLLKALAGIFSANTGTIDLKGHNISLLAIGVGFQKSMTGRQNVMLSGMLLGFSEKEINEKMDAIIEFAELGKFIDRPVKTYSSGMYSKLAFSITVVLEADIILIDEVLSVGDQKFKRKSYNKMKELIAQHDRTVVIVSHSITTLEELCDKVMWMHEGEIVEIGESKQVLANYVEFMEK
jgi:ABC-type polysaccharide/polyol phosphate transport system, ATPase component